ncbi:inositol polyphosphate-5-phosphatase A-like isoform X1 [Pleurodeles waltl]|uniref:inositol polyphosphate-5-phosphatase A-like isoform X1 n=1 Tax=Pleurodeles waltl TaxID=8319 RepID=UPI003709BC14
MSMGTLSPAGVLLITANVGSLFDYPAELQQKWLQEFYKTLDLLRPGFIALHWQEVGGKNYKQNMQSVETFIRTMAQSAGFSEYDRSRTYIDSNFDNTSGFTALGSLYFLHRSLGDTFEFDFREKKFLQVTDQKTHIGSLDTCPTVEKEKFEQNFWPEFSWTRKGYMRSRWRIQGWDFDLVNIHLFHDASNLVACDASPSVYTGNRKKALEHVIQRVTDDRFPHVPFFLFGDFNFRLDTRSLIQTLSSCGRIQMVRSDSGSVLEKIIREETEENQKVLLHIKTKLFEYLNQAVFREDNGRALQAYDKELLSFQNVLFEEPVRFPPSYPYSEDDTKPTEYENTRCPSWCDRVLMSSSAYSRLKEETRNGSQMVYENFGASVCMGDHKVVFEDPPSWNKNQEHLQRILIQQLGTYHRILDPRTPELHV